MAFTNAQDLASQLASDGEFKQMAKGWTGGFVFNVGSAQTIAMSIADGEPSEGIPQRGEIFTFTGPEELWQALFMPTPPRFANDLAPLMLAGLQMTGDELAFTQYYAAIMRAVELVRGVDPNQVRTVSVGKKSGEYDAPVGRYIHLELEGQMYRVYYEEAGQGIPILLQHTAGSHGTQWRHLFEYPEITDKFRLIAYDLPFHGKSVPPTGREWWGEEYKLTTSFAEAVPVELAKALELDRPVYMGCSVGGALAIDLAADFPGFFRAVIAVEGALLMDDGDGLDTYAHRAFFHPKVSNVFKGRLMHAVTSPTAPEAYRQETIQTYMAGWPPAFIGDLNYYVTEFDARDKAASIDTNKTAVHIMNGEYDFSGTWEKGEAAQQAIKGSTWTKMEGMGHFPMSEDPDKFVDYLRPILAQIS